MTRQAAERREHRRAARPAGPPRSSTVCTCKPRPYVLATFRHGQLVSVVRMHNRHPLYWEPATEEWRPARFGRRCGLPAEPLDVPTWRDG